MAAVTLMVCYFAESLLFIRIAMVVLGLCAGLNQPSSTATVAAMVSRQDWGKALSLQQSGPRLSYAVAPLLAIGLLAAFSWQTGLVVIGAFAALCTIAFAIWGRSGIFPGTPPDLRSMASLLRRGSVWLMICLFTLGTGGQAGLYNMMPLYLTGQRGFSTATVRRSDPGSRAKHSGPTGKLCPSRPIRTTTATTLQPSRWPTNSPTADIDDTHQVSASKDRTL